MMSVDEAMHMATQLQSENKLEQAEIILNRILAANPSHAYALHLLGIIAYQAGKIALGIQLIEQAIQNNSQVALFYSNLGEMHRQLKATHLSIQCGQHAVALDPNSATVLSNLGIAYYDAKQYEQAEQCHNQALAINPQLSCSLNNMGSIYKAKGQTKQAIEFYQAAIAVSPYFVEPLNNLGVLFLLQQEYRQALEYLSQAIILAPAFSDAHCNIGLTYLGLDQCSNALMHFEKALQLKPDFAEAYYGMAQIHLNQHHFAESEFFIRKAISTNPQAVEFYKFLAEIYHQQGNHEQALMYLDQALSLDSTHTGLYLSKGSVLMEMGEISKAEEHLLKISADQIVDTRIFAHYSLVQLRKIKSDNSSFNDLLAIVNNHIQAVSPGKLEYLYFALGKCHDDMGQWQKAFEYFSLGCHLKRTRITYNIAEQIQFMNKLIACFTPQIIEHLRAFANPSALPIFIVGMPRSGSTLVEQILSSHPQVYGAGELKYFNHLIQWPVKKQQTTIYYPENILQLSPEIGRAITNKYLAYLRRFSADALRITDKMPHHFIAIGLIHALFPNAKIIHVQRNPIDTCLSCYTKLFTEGHFYSYDLTELGQYYRCYERIMNHWRHILPSDAWLDITYESVVNHLDVEVKRLIEFCDLAWDPACLAFYRSKRQVRTASFAQVRQPVYTSSIERWQRYERELAPLINALNANFE
ncbi:MAG TPA: sulfotransferase [Gammaproteobacteria bacterium]|jgi:tetratricopeptide (TPR) repeat protein|nr:sulfotransferase [Gammaproteobacteria bacterium]